MSGPVAGGPQVESDVVGPWQGLALAAAAAVRDLNRRFGLDLWLVTYVDDDRQVVVASAGPWTALSPPGVSFPWAESFCRQMVTRLGPVAESDVHRSKVLAQVATGERAQVRAYVGVPLLSTEGRMFGTLCAFAGEAQPPSMAAVLEPVKFVGRMLSTIIAGEQQAADRSQEAATAYALAERDRQTGLRNRRGFESALESEEKRSRRYGSAVSVVSVDVERLPEGCAVAKCGAVLNEGCRPGDLAARVDAFSFACLAVECDAVCVRALTLRLRIGLRTAGLTASVGCATRRPDEGLCDTWRRAREASAREGRRRRSRPPRSDDPSAG